jgi:hypothetical protein
MKHKLQIAVMLGAFVMLLIPSAFAQNGAKATIPFDFTVGNKTVSAGDYTIARVSSEHPQLLVLRDSDGEAQAIISGIVIEAIENNGHARLLFNKYEDRYFLSQVWLSDTESGTSVPKTRLERELVASKDHNGQKRVVEMAP